MRSIKAEQANAYLSNIGMQIGDWNQIVDIPGRHSIESPWVKYRPPRDSLLNFSYYATQWLPRGEWKILQLDNSTGWIDPVQASLICGLIFGPKYSHDINQAGGRTFFVKFDEKEDANQNSELLIANLIYVILLFELHGYIVSSNSHFGQLLAIQDGFVYFSSREKYVSGAELLIRDFKKNPVAPPQWITEIISACQEKILSKE